MKSLSQECLERGLNYHTVRTRINQLGWSRADALKGRSKTLADMAREEGLKPATFYARLKKGWSLSRAKKQNVRKTGKAATVNVSCASCGTISERKRSEVARRGAPRRCSSCRSSAGKQRKVCVECGKTKASVNVGRCKECDSANRLIRVRILDEEFTTIELAAASDLPRRVVYERIRSGMDPLLAIATGFHSNG
jgi:hypothetical protein